MAQVFIESDLVVAIRAIKGEINPLSQIRNLVEDINILAQTVKIIKLVNSL